MRTKNINKASKTLGNTARQTQAAPRPKKENLGYHLGRLTSIGLREPWQVAFLLPHKWQNLTRVLRQFHVAKVEEGEWVVAQGKLLSEPTMRFDGRPRLIGYLQDQAGQRLGFSQFGDTRRLAEILKINKENVYLFGQVRHFNNTLWLQNIERIPSLWINRLRPQYPGKTGVIAPEKVRERVFANLRQAIPTAAEWLRRELSSIGNEVKLLELADYPETTLETLLTKAHLPATVQQGIKAQEALEYLAALGTVKKASAQRLAGQSTPISTGDWEQRAYSLPFAITAEQQAAVADIVADLKASGPMRRLLIGDVGTGKTAVYALAAMACADVGHKVAILLPSMPLASQVFGDFRTWWPDARVQLVTADSEGIDPSCSIFVGTTALFNRMKTESSPALLIVDEQQKFSREQREFLAGRKTNILEVSATCIPRSQALAKYGIVQVSMLKTCHVKKKIHTRVWTADLRIGLFEQVRQTLERGSQVLVIYPRREGTENDTPEQAKHTVEEAYRAWNRLYPGRVRFSHGSLKDQEKDQAVRDLKEGSADILIATTVVEVGINLPRLQRVLIVHPDRLGLSVLHQLRGRVARAGGAGWCDLYLPKPVKPETMERLEVLTKTEDGFELSEMDMKLRGIGDLGALSNKQTGADDSFLFGRPVRLDMLDKIIDTFKRPSKCLPQTREDPDPESFLESLYLRRCSY